jgi:large subunit ribosomal protein L2
MGKPLIQQRRGKGSPAYTAPSHRFFTKLKYPKNLAGRGQVVRFIDDPARTTILAEILMENKQKIYNIATEGMRIGSEVKVNGFNAGDITEVGALKEGTPVYNIELKPQDGGKLVRASGSVAYIENQDEESNQTQILLPSKKTVSLPKKCLATIGVPAGGGRLEKPFKKAGKHYHAALARGKEFPVVRGSAMSAYNHPFGGRSFGKPTTVPRSTPPGRKVGHIAAKATGRKKK